MNKRPPFLLSPDSSGGGAADTTPPSPPTGDATPAPPPAASAVMASGVSEDEAGELVKTKRERDDERKARVEREKRISELEDENRQLKSAGLRPDPTPPPAREKKSWLSGLGTVLDD